MLFESTVSGGNQKLPWDLVVEFNIRKSAGDLTYRKEIEDIKGHALEGDADQCISYGAAKIKRKFERRDERTLEILREWGVDTEKPLDRQDVKKIRETVKAKLAARKAAAIQAAPVASVASIPAVSGDAPVAPVVTPAVLPVVAPPVAQ